MNNMSICDNCIFNQEDDCIVDCSKKGASKGCAWKKHGKLRRKKRV